MPKQHPQLWMVFFGPGQDPGRIARHLARGWQHVCCASFQAELGVWQYVNPARDRTYFLTLTPEAFSPYFARLLGGSTAIVEFAAQDGRRFCPTFASCVGVVKGILGVRSWALTPRALHRDLCRRGASLVSTDERSEDQGHEQYLWRRRAIWPTPGRPGSGAGAATG